MKEAKTIDEAKNFVSQYQNFYIDATNKTLLNYITQLQDDIECEVDVNCNTNKAIIYIL